MNLNKVTLIGRVVKDPVSSEFENKKYLTKFTVVTNKRYKDKELPPEFHDVVAFGPLAQIAKEYLYKGRLIYVSGRLKTSKWTDTNNLLRQRTEIIADEMLLLDRQQALVNAASEAGATEAMQNEYATVAA